MAARLRNEGGSVRLVLLAVALVLIAGVAVAGVGGCPAKGDWLNG